MNTIKRGDIWLAVWPNDPGKKPRPVLVVSNNFRNSAPHLLDVVVVKLTSLLRSDGSQKPVNMAEDVVIELNKKSIVRCSAIYSVEKSFLSKKLVHLSEPIIARVNHCLRITLNLA
jgi:mRNA-degrading endonuclease toxin of MazEF toxin-antitoxin module